MLTDLQNIYNNITGNSDFILTPDMKITDLGLSSLGLIQLVCAMEDEYDIEIRNSDLKKFKTVKNVVDCLKEKTE